MPPAGLKTAFIREREPAVFRMRVDLPFFHTWLRLGLTFFGPIPRRSGRRFQMLLSAPPSPSGLPANHQPLPLSQKVSWVEGGICPNTTPGVNLKSGQDPSRARADAAVSPGRKRKLQARGMNDCTPGPPIPADIPSSTPSSSTCNPTCNAKKPNHDAFVAVSPVITGTTTRDQAPQTCLVNENCVTLAASPSPNIPGNPLALASSFTYLKHPTELDLGPPMCDDLGARRMKVRRILSAEPATGGAEEEPRNHVVPITLEVDSRCSTPEELIIRDETKRCPAAPRRMVGHDNRDDVVRSSRTQVNKSCWN